MPPQSALCAHVPLNQTHCRSLAHCHKPQYHSSILGAVQWQSCWKTFLIILLHIHEVTGGVVKNKLNITLGKAAFSVYCSFKKTILTAHTSSSEQIHKSSGCVGTFRKLYTNPEPPAEPGQILMLTKGVALQWRVPRQGVTPQHEAAGLVSNVNASSFLNGVFYICCTAYFPG